MPLFIVLAGIAALLLLMIVFRFNAFIALILVALGTGLAQGLSPAATLASIQNGIGSTLGYLTLVLGFGSMLGTLVAESGAAQRITTSLTGIFGEKRLPWAVMLTGFVVGIPMFYSVGFIMLIPIIFTIAASTRLPLLYVGIPMVSALSVTHGFLPPHPGPTAVALIYNADVGLTLVYGLAVAVPAVILAGPVFAQFLRNYHTPRPKGLFETKPRPESELPGLGISIFTALFPVLLMAVAALAKVALGETEAPFPLGLLLFAGEPVMALLIAVLLAIFTLGLRNGRGMKEVMDFVTASVSSIAMILLIIGGGGAFKQVLIDSGVGDYIAELMEGASISPLVLAWAIAAGLRISLGSATVAALTAAGIVAPLVNTTGVSPELMVLATGAGSLMLSNINDTGFWMFKEYFNLSIGQTFATWSVMETIVSVMGLLGSLLLQQFV